MIGGSERRLVPLRRDCTARLVPAGTAVTLRRDTFVTVTQSLGGNYTVVANGNMARIDATDADALGFEPLVLAFGPADPAGAVDPEHVHVALRTVYDPEIPVNLVDLGLIYGCAVERDPDGRQVVRIRMTLTAPGCGMGPVLVEDVRRRVSLVPNVDHVEVELVFDPPWSRERMSEEAQLELGML